MRATTRNLKEPTFLKWLGLQINSGNLEAKNSRRYNKKLPFFLQLRQYKDGDFPAPDDWLRRAPHLRALAGLDPTWIISRLNEGRAVVMLDGVDEVPKQHRGTLANWIDGLITAYPRCIFILTSRPLDDDQQDFHLQSDIKRFYVRGMNTNTVDDFIDKWYRAYAQRHTDRHVDELEDIAKTLKDRYEKDHRLRSMITTPLLCATACAYYIEHYPIYNYDQNQVAFYERIVDLLVHERDEMRQIESNEQLKLTKQEKKIILAYIAFRLILDRTEMPVARDVLKEYTYVAMDNIKSLLEYGRDIIDAGVVLGELIERTSIFQESVKNHYEFLYDSFKHYLAAYHISDHSQSNYHTLLGRITEPSWTEIGVIFAGVSTFENRNRLVTDLLERSRKHYDAAQLDESDDALQQAYRYALIARACRDINDYIDYETMNKLDEHLRDYIGAPAPDNLTYWRGAGTLALPFLEYQDDLSERDQLLRLTVMRGMIQDLSPAALQASPQLFHTLSMFNISTQQVYHGLVNIRNVVPAGLQEEYIRRVLYQPQQTKLMLSGQPLRQQIDGLHLLDYVESLVVDGVAIHPLAALNGLVKLRELKLINTHRFDVLGQLKYMEGAMLERIVIDRVGIRSLIFLEEIGTDLAKRAKLRSVTLRNCEELNNINQLSPYNNLTELIIDGCPRLRDAHVVSGLRLRTLTLVYTDIATLPHFKQPQLTHLNISDNRRLKDISTIIELTELLEIDLSRSDKIMDYTPLVDVPTLQRIVVGSEEEKERIPYMLRTLVEVANV